MPCLYSPVPRVPMPCLYSPVPRLITTIHPRFLALCGLAVLCGSALAQEPISIEYTGALFGYYRMESNESDTDPKLSPVKAFWSDKDHNPKENLVLGMGDNFGPEFGAGIQMVGRVEHGNDCYQPTNEPGQPVEDPLYARNEPPVAMYKDKNRIAKTASCDNVARFLMAAGYRAVVPGREDFLYTSEWLQSIAAKLRDASKGPAIVDSEQKAANPEEKLHLLAANLRINSKQGCPLLFSDRSVPVKEDTVKKPTREAMTQCVSSEGEIIPVGQDWVERLDLTLESQGLAKRISEGAKDSVDVRRQILINQVSMTLSVLPPNLDLSLAKLKHPGEYELRGDSVSVSDKQIQSIASVQRKICGSTPQNQDLCQVMNELYRVFSALKDPCAQKQQDFLFSFEGRQAMRRLLLHDIATEEEDRGYTLSQRKGLSTTLLIGVVGPETMKAVSPTNLHYKQNEVEGDVYVLDPRRTVEIVLRAAALAAQGDNDQIEHVIVMAQMPHTEAEELGAAVRADLDRLAKNDNRYYRIDLILSEAQAQHASPELKLKYRPGGLVPVLTPHPAFNYSSHGLVTPVSTAILTLGMIKNKTRSDPVSQEGATTTLERLQKLVDMPVSRQDSLHIEGAAAIRYFLELLQKSSHADVVLLERRDIYLGPLPNEYAGYEVCDEWDYKQSPKAGPDPKRRCKLHVALDRVLWTGDYSERVMVTGKDLKDIIKAAQDQVKQQQSLAAPDTTNQWLVSFGITTNDQQNLTRLESGIDRFNIPWSKACKGDTKEEVHYCVNGASIQDDAGYWVATSDHIANDTITYTSMSSLPRDYRQLKRASLAVASSTQASAPSKRTRELFITDELTKTLRGV